MPELPDLVYILKELSPRLMGRRITDVTVKEPIVIRMMVAGSFKDALAGKTFMSAARNGPFITFGLGDDMDLVVHHMLSGRLQLGPAQGHGGPKAGAAKDGRAPAQAKPLPHLCFTLTLDDGSALRYGDDTRMGKVYVTAAGGHAAIPGYDTQGLDILSTAFTREAFESLIKGRRHQVRVFIMDQSALSAIGNAYADEILFAAGIHPKTSCSSLTEAERGKLYESIRSVISWGIREVEDAGKPTEVKVRDHMRVRNRKGEACPVCGTTIRTVGVLGYDSFFCPRCQPAKREQKIPW